MEKSGRPDREELELRGRGHSDKRVTTIQTEQRWNEWSWEGGRALSLEMLIPDQTAAWRGCCREQMVDKSQHLEIMGRKRGAPPPPPLLQEKNATSLGHVLPTEMKVSTLVVFKHFLKNFLKIFMTVKVILCNRETDAFDVSPFHFYLRTRLRHKLLGWAPGVPLVLWAPALVVPLVPMGLWTRNLPPRLQRPYSVRSREDPSAAMAEPFCARVDRR